MSEYKKQISRKTKRKNKKTKLIRRKLIRIVFLCIMIFLTYRLILAISDLSIFNKDKEEIQTEINIENNSIKEVKEETVEEDDNLTKIQIEDETDEEVKIRYVDGVLLVNKNNPIPEDYNPGVNEEAKAAFDKMTEVAKEQDLSIYIVSGFRSYDTQKKLYENYVAKYGQSLADTFSAKPGHSEHQTGLAFDVCSVEDVFGDTQESKWLALNAHRFGFIIRYPEGKEDITGYKYEPWHIRYLGVDIATKVYNSGLTLEEYLNVD